MSSLPTRLITYLKDAKLELQKVTWPSRKDIVRYSVIVIAASIIVAAVFGALDLGFTKGLNKLIDWTA